MVKFLVGGILAGGSKKGRGRWRQIAKERFDAVRRIVRNLGPPCAARFVALRLFGWATSRRIWTLHPPGGRAIRARTAGTSDLDVFGQVFSGDEYASVSDLENVSFVIDGGANVGYSAAYFLSCYPAATVVSIEPDPENAALLRRNLAPYGERSVVIEGALWSTAQDLLLHLAFGTPATGAGRSNRSTVSTKRAVAGMTVGDVMAAAASIGSRSSSSTSKGPRPSCSATATGRGSVRWTRSSSLHDARVCSAGTERFRAALADLDPVYAESSELTIASTGPTRYAAGTG